MNEIHYWIQLENRQWDASPHNIDRMTGHDMKHSTITGKDPVEVVLKMPGGMPGTNTRTMYNHSGTPAGTSRTRSSSGGISRPRSRTRATPGRWRTTGK